MRISLVPSDDGLEADVSWTASDTQRIWFRGGTAQASAHAFLVAAYLPACVRGEASIEMQADPSLVAGLKILGEQARHWWGWIPPKIIAHPPALNMVAGPASCFLTGGVDSLFTLHRNLATYPEGHPWRIKRAITVYGLERGMGGDDYEAGQSKFAEVAEVLEGTLEPFGIELIRADTNIKILNLDADLYAHAFHGVWLAAVAHSLGPGRYSIAASTSIPTLEDLEPWGSHPLWEPLCSDRFVTIVHDGYEVSRLDKLRFLRDRKLDLSGLHVCFDNEPQVLNCGKCRKCIRTAVEIQALNIPHPLPQMVREELGREAIEAAYIISVTDRRALMDARDEFQRNGHSHEAGILSENLQSYDANKRRVLEQDWRGPIKRALRRAGLRR